MRPDAAAAAARRRRRLEAWLPWLVTLAAFLAWEAGVRLFGVPEFVLPAPSAIAASMARWWRPLLDNALATLATTLAGFALAVGFGLLLGVAGGEDVARFVRRTVGPVLDYDRERGSELARTLLTWYACGGNLTRTAAELYVHVNTLYQRLDRVTQLLGEGWRSGDGALQTHLALQAHRALGGTTT